MHYSRRPPMTKDCTDGERDDRDDGERGDDFKTRCMCKCCKSSGSEEPSVEGSNRGMQTIFLKVGGKNHSWRILGGRLTE